MRCIFPSGILLDPAPALPTTLSQPALPGSMQAGYKLGGGIACVQLIEAGDFRFHMVTARINEPETFEIRQLKPAEFLILCLGGRITLQEHLAGSHILGQGHGLLITGQALQGFCTLQPSGKDGQVLLVSGEYARLLKAEACSVPQPFILPAGMAEMVDKILFASYTAVKPFHQEQLSELFSQAHKAASATSAVIIITDSDLVIFHQLKKWLDDNMDKDLTLDQLARKMGISAKKMNRGFQSLYGKTVIHYRREQRLTQAHDQITGSYTALKVIGRAAGYHSYSNFSSAFRERFGKAPVDLRKEKRPPS
jgi:AraC-like DNA-binding protein